MSKFKEEINNHPWILAQEYQNLIDLTVLTQEQEERLSYILNRAVQDSCLDELIQMIEIANFRPEDEPAILDQQAKMREYLAIEPEPFRLPIHLI